MKIAYLIPEFPGQTHIFFWRERRALRAQGIETQLVSTRPPSRKLMSHDWSRDASAETAYLWPMRKREVLQAVLEILQSGPGGWFRCLRSIARAEGLSIKKRLRLLGVLLVAGKLHRLMRQQQLTHVHVHFVGDAAHLAMFAHLLGDITYSLSLHAPLAEYGGNQREKWRYARFGTVITKKLMAELRQTLAGTLPERIDIAPMGVEVSRFARPAPYVPWDGNGPARLFCCARLTPAKGHGTLIQAVQLLRNQGVNVKLTIAGEDKLSGAGYRKDLQNLVTSLNLTEHIVFLGAVNEQVVFDQLCAAHIFVLASIAEALGVAYMEAMASQTPTIGTNAGGVPELIDDGIDGRLVPPQDAPALADAINSVLRDPALARRLSDGGLRKITEHFSSDNSARVLAKCVRDTVD